MTQRLVEELKYVARDLRTGDLEHPTRVAVDGFCASGKTTIADALAVLLSESDVSAIRISADNFQNPPEIRWQLGEMSPEGFYRHAIDFESIKTEVLLPLGLGGSMRYRTATYDIHALRPIESEQHVAAADSILLVDGLFLLAPSIRSHFDYTIFVDAPFEVCIQRARGRNQERRDDANEIERLYRQRYVPGYRLYLDDVRPRDIASTTIGND